MTLNNIVASLVSNIRVTMKHKRNNNRTHYSKFAMIILKKLAEKNIVSEVSECIINKRKYITFKMMSYNHVYMIDKIFSFYKVSSYRYVNLTDLHKLKYLYENGLITTNRGVLFLNDCLRIGIGGKLILLYR